MKYECELEQEIDHSTDGFVKVETLYIKHSIEADSAMQAAEKFRTMHGYTPNSVRDEGYNNTYFQECAGCMKIFDDDDLELTEQVQEDGYIVEAVLMCSECIKKENEE